MRSRGLAILAGLVAMVFGLGTVANAAPEAQSSYIVQLANDADATAQRAIGKQIKALGGLATREYRNVIRGFAANLTPTAANALAQAPGIKSVMPDAQIRATDVQSPTPSWGLDRLDQVDLPLNSSFEYPANAGAGVRIFVLDTGIQTNDPDFAGRVIPGVDFVGDGRSPDVDCQGHGTHVAGTAAGSEFGVAKKAYVTSLRVLNCTGSGSFSYFISAIDYIGGLNLNGMRAVATASLGADNYILTSALDAVNNLVAKGVVVTLAAGNGSTDACNTSPAAARDAITVGATTSSDARASYSNFGTCLDIFAPGSNITSDLNTNPTGTWTISGTSMATPHVAGVAASYLALNPAATPADFAGALRSNALADKVTGAGVGSPNYLMNLSFMNGGPALTVADAPTDLVSTAAAGNSISVGWAAPVGSGTYPVTSYVLDYKSAAAATWSSLVTTATSATVSGLTAGTSYNFRVKAVSNAGFSANSAQITVSTTVTGNAPSAPTAPVARTIYSNQVNLSWTAPSSNGGQPITGYKIQQLSGIVWNTVATVTTTSGVASGLTPSTAYSFRVLATNIVGDSAPSTTVNATTLSASPAKVNTPSVTVGSSGKVTVKWTAVPVVTFGTPIVYRVEFLNSAGTSVVQTYDVSTTSLAVTLARLTGYKVRVTAMSGTNLGPASTTVNFTTK